MKSSPIADVYSLGPATMAAQARLAMGDAELVQRYARQKDAEAFAELVRRYQAMVWATCRRTCYEMGDAEDAVQEVYLRLAQNAGRLRANLGAWLHRCAVNVAVDLNRKRIRRRKHEGQARADRPQRADTADREALLIDPGEQVDLAMSQLDAEQRGKA